LQVFGEYGYISDPALTGKRAPSGQLTPFRPAQHVQRGALGEFGSYEWRATPFSSKQADERKALAPFRPARVGGGVFSG